MFATVILAASLLTQAPAPTSPHQAEHQAGIAAQVQKNRAKKAAKAQRYTVNRAAEDRAAASAAAKAEADYKAALPYLLENQRQQLQFQAQTQGNVLRYPGRDGFEQRAAGRQLPTVIFRDSARSVSGRNKKAGSLLVTGPGPKQAPLFKGAFHVNSTSRFRPRQQREPPPCRDGPDSPLDRGHRVPGRSRHPGAHRRPDR